MKELENESLSTTTINIFEILYGAKISKKPKENVNEIKKVIKNLNIFPFDFNSCEEASSILANLKKTGKIIGLRDLFISETCRSNNLGWVTRNVKHFENISELKVEGY